MTDMIFPEIEGSTEISWVISQPMRRFRATQKKNKHGYLLAKVSLYTMNRGGGDYYNTTAFAIFSSRWHLEQFIGVNLSVHSDFEVESQHTESEEVTVL